MKKVIIIASIVSIAMCAVTAIVTTKLAKRPLLLYMEQLKERKNNDYK